MTESGAKIKDFLQKQPGKIRLYGQQRDKCVFQALYMGGLLELCIQRMAQVVKKLGRRLVVITVNSF